MQFLIYSYYISCIYFLIHGIIIVMDEITKRKLRAVGAIAVLVGVVLSIFFSFYKIKEKKNTTMRLRSFYSDMQQTLQFSMNLNFTPDVWGFKGKYRNVNTINNYIAQYLRVEKNCVAEADGCFPDVFYKNFMNKPTKVNLSNIPSVVLNNNIAIAFETISSCKKPESVCAVVYVDMNSVQPPNTFGKDLFVFMLLNSKQKPFLPYNMKLPREVLIEDTKLGCNKEAEMPMYCSAYLFDNDWIMDKKYPW